MEINWKIAKNVFLHIDRQLQKFEDNDLINLFGKFESCSVFKKKTKNYFLSKKLQFFTFLNVTWVLRRNV